MCKALCYELWQIQREVRHDSCPQENSSSLNLVYRITKVIKERFYELWQCFWKLPMHENHLGKLLKMQISYPFPGSPMIRNFHFSHTSRWCFKEHWNKWWWNEHWFKRHVFALSLFLPVTRTCLGNLFKLTSSNSIYINWDNHSYICINWDNHSYIIGIL